MVVSMLNKLYKYYLVGTLTNKELEVLESYISDTSTEDSLRNIVEFYFSDTLSIMENPISYYNEITNNEEDLDDDEDEVLIKIRNLDESFKEKQTKLISILEKLEETFYDKNVDLYDETKLIFKFVRFRTTIYSYKDLYTHIYSIIKKTNKNIDIEELFKKIVNLFEKEKDIPLRLAVIDFDDILHLCFGEFSFEIVDFFDNLKYFVEVIDNNIGIRLYTYLKYKLFDLYYKKSMINKLYVDVFDIIKKWYNREVKIINKRQLEEMFVDNLMDLNSIEQNEKVIKLGNVYIVPKVIKLRNVYIVPKDVLRTFIINGKEQIQRI